MSELQLKTLTGATKSVPQQALDAFAMGFRGALVRPMDPSYEETRKIWNAMIDRKPGLILRCSGTADVLHAVRFAREHQLLVSVRGGGHNIAGTAVCDGGVMIDLSRMTGVVVDPKGKVIHAQAGCTLGHVDRESQLYGLAAVLGFVSTTGIAGLTVGGGIGYLTRRYGWTCDNVRSMEVVTAEGRLVRASADENSELFWCLRGGSGNFGIVTSFEYNGYPVGPEIMAGAMAWRGEDAPEVMAFFKEFSEKAPRELTCVAALRKAPPAPWLPADVHGKNVVLMIACHTGKPEEGERLVAPLKSFGKPVADILTRRPYAQMQSLLDATQPPGRRYYWKSEYLGDLTPRALTTIHERAAQVPSPHSLVALFQLEGALNQLPADHSPAGNRDAKYVLNIGSAWEQKADDETNIAWTRGTWEAMRPFGTGGVYINFLTEDEGLDRTEAAFGSATLDRLRALKRKLDPDNFFRHTKQLG